MELDFKLDFQVGTSKKAHKILKQLSGRDDDENKISNPKAPFKSMADAYLFALILGLSTGEKTPIPSKQFINYANFSSVEKDYDLATLINNLGEKSDMADKESAKKAIQEYATWGLERLGDQKHGEDDYRIAELLESLLDGSQT